MRFRDQRQGGARTLAPTASPHQRTLARGLELHQAGRLAEAEAIYRQVLAAEPRNHAALHLLGALANQVGQHAAAVELISQAVQIEPTAASYHSNLGVAHQRLGQLEEAVACYERALALQPDHVDALNNLGVASQALGRLDVALSSFERSLKLRPNHAETLNNVGALYLALTSAALEGDIVTDGGTEKLVVAVLKKDADRRGELLPLCRNARVNAGDADVRFLVISAPTTRGDRTDLEAERGMIAAQVRAALQGLPSDQRSAIELVYFNGLSSQEVGTLLGVPSPTVRSRLRLGLLKLGTVLKEQGLVAID